MGGWGRNVNKLDVSMDEVLAVDCNNCPGNAQSQQDGLQF
jgi:hypothetical protein